MSFSVAEAVRAVMLLGASVGLLMTACALDALEFALGIAPEPANEERL